MTRRAACLLVFVLIFITACDPAFNRALGQRMAADRGWVDREWSCLDTLINDRESSWRDDAGRPNHSYGIPQSNPGTKMASHGADWMTNPVVQIAWMLDYITGRYGTPCAALAHSMRYSSY